MGFQELLFGTCARSYQVLLASTCAEYVLALNFQRWSQHVDELTELSAGHPGQFRVLEQCRVRRAGLSLIRSLSGVLPVVAASVRGRRV